MEKIYSFLTDSLTLSILQPVIVGITIQFVAHHLKIHQQKEDATRCGLLLYHELRSHKLAYDSLLYDRFKFTVTAKVYNRLDTTVWNAYRHLLIALPKDLIASISTYYLAVEGYNLAMPYADENNFQYCIEALKESSLMCDMVMVALSDFLDAST